MNAAHATRPDISTSNLQQIFDYISTAMASASASAIISQGTRIPLEPTTARTANLREAICFSPVMELFRCSLESKASSPCQHSKPSASPARRHSQLLLRTYGQKCGRYSHEGNGFMINWKSISGCLTLFFLGIRISLFIWMAILRLR
jgi:hypothetical protein